MRESFCVPNEWLWKTLFMYWNLLYKALYRYRVGRLTGGYIAKWWLKLFDRLATRFNDQTICHVWAEIFVYFIYTVSATLKIHTYTINYIFYIKLTRKLNPHQKPLGERNRFFKIMNPLNTIHFMYLKLFRKAFSPTT